VIFVYTGAFPATPDKRGGLFMENKQVSLVKSILFTICSILVLDSFVSPAIIGVSSITIWVITAIVFFIPYGLISAELGAAYPDDGGIASWVTRAFGEKAGVLVGWYYWINVGFWMPAVFVAFATWFSYAFASAASPWILAGIAVVMCWVVVWIGVRGIELSVTVSSVAAIMKAAVMLLFGFMGISYGIKFGLANDFSLHSFAPSFGNTTQYIAVIAYNLLGFELIGAIGSKIKDPGRTVPKMTIFAGIAITALFVFGTFGILAAIPASKVDTVDGFYYALQELCTVFGPAAKPVFYVTIVVTLLTLVSNMITWSLGANETLMGAELDKRSKFLGHRSKKYGTPDNLYYILGAVSTLLIALNYALSGDANEIFWTIFSFSTLIFFLSYLFMFPAAVKLRFSDPDTERPYSIPGGKFGITLCAILGELVIGACVVFLFKDSGGGFPLWVLIIGTLLTTATGFWLYAAGRNKDEEI